MLGRVRVITFTLQRAACSIGDAVYSSEHSEKVHFQSGTQPGFRNWVPLYTALKCQL